MITKKLIKLLMAEIDRVNSIMFELGKVSSRLSILDKDIDRIWDKLWEHERIITKFKVEGTNDGQ